MKHFINTGFGWTCLHCQQQEQSTSEKSLARFMREGEAEDREPRLSSPALARWTDESRTKLRCLRCGAEEKLI